MNDAKEKNNENSGKNALEWVVFALSLLIVGAVLSFLGLETLRHAPTPPRLEISLGEPQKAGNQMLVPVQIENRGGVTAASVEIEVKRRQKNESASFSLPYVPDGEKRQGWVSFQAPLEKNELEARVLGYEEP